MLIAVIILVTLLLLRFFIPAIINKVREDVRTIKEKLVGEAEEKNGRRNK